MLPVSVLVPLITFMALLLDLALLVLAVSGHFPRAQNQNDRIGAVSIYGAIIVAALTAIAGIAAAIALIPWYAAVIAGGLSILCAPLLLQMFSDDFVDGRGSLTAFSVIAIVLAVGFLFATGVLPQ
ncbi:MAG: hypothetical protein JO205_13455 [Pseudolabrys sp.]|nr:hypothetical protein [Pseudolabrys sp.]MBV9262366.1 hypothetical protein [Pseudolabrys sp.]